MDTPGRGQERTSSIDSATTSTDSAPFMVIPYSVSSPKTRVMSRSISRARRLHVAPDLDILAATLNVSADGSAGAPHAEDNFCCRATSIAVRLHCGNRFDYADRTDAPQGFLRPAALRAAADRGFDIRAAAWLSTGIPAGARWVARRDEHLDVAP